MTKRVYRVAFLVLLTGGMAMAQEPPAGWFQELPVKELSQAQFSEQAANEKDLQFFQQNQVFDRLAKERMMQDGGLLLKMNPVQKGRWWSNPKMAELLGLTGDQVKRMDDIFQQHRLKLIDLNASLEKEEAILDPLVGADQPDDNKVMAQIDRVAQARAELEKANSRMLWSIRRVLTPEQWNKLQTGASKPLIRK